MKKLDELKILCVDDEPFVLEVLTDLLRIYGVRDIDVALNGVEALAKVKKETYDVILSDVAMPKMDGFELMKNIRSIDMKQPAIVLISGHSNPSISKTIEVGANAFLGKPIDSNILLSILRGLTGKILVVEDSETIRYMTTKSLSRFGYDVVGAMDGKEALKLLDEDPPDVVVLDLVLPHVSGFEVLEQIRNRYSSLEVPVIVVTANTKRSSLLRSMAMGANDVVYKPIQADTLLMRIRNQLTMKSLGLDMQAAKEEAMESARIKGRFLANMSHEIRTPLNSIIGMTNYVRTFDMEKELGECLDIVGNAGETLLRTVNDILDFSKAEALELHLESISFDMEKELKSVIDGAKRTTENTNQNKVELNFISTDLPPCLIGDSQRLKQVVYNLLGNALKFTESGRVTVTAEGLGDSKGRSAIRIEVEDTGIGISKEKAESIFSPFSQADASTSRKYGGTGLGLTIASAIVELMGGKLRVESEVGKGSKFSFEIILQVGESSEIAKENLVIEKSVNKLNILVVDDTENNQKVAGKMLKKMGHAIEIAVNGKEALDLVTNKNYDLVFMDCQMPIMDGYEAASKIRLLRDSSAKVPIVAMTAHVTMGEKDKCISSGMDDYMSKPFLIADLANMVEKWTRGSDEKNDEGDSRMNKLDPDNLVDFVLVNQLAELQDEDEPNFFSDQTNLFYKRAITLYSQIKSAVENNESRDLQRSAHALKGSASVVGAKKIASICATIEDIGNDGEPSDAQQYLSSLDKSLKDTRVAFDGIIVDLKKAS
jgi:CheY-like chemotaxis protein/HPt (histidine-containing phosphotransfer) domain-containing protein